MTKATQKPEDTILELEQRINELKKDTHTRKFIF